MSQSQPVSFETTPQTRRSIFRNYADDSPPASGPLSAEPASQPAVPATGPGQGAEIALARSFLFQFLARAFEYPSPETWSWLCHEERRRGLGAAVGALAPDPQAPLPSRLASLLPSMHSRSFHAYHDSYITAIGHAARGSCPINEIEYGDLKADPLFQPHRLADLAAFYRAFGVELGADAGERHDHLSVELEFMAVLAAQEAHALAAGVEAEPLAICREAQQKFLREHLGRWTPAFARRLHRATGDGPLAKVALLTLAFIEEECRRLGVPSGSEDLFLRPADEDAALCESCGLNHTLPGAAASPPAS